MKPKVIFIHPLKTGGTSVRYMLLDEYGAGRIAPALREHGFVFTSVHLAMRKPV